MENKRGKFWIRVAIVVAGILVHQLLLPWWGLPLACLLCGYLTAPMNRSAFMAGFLGGFVAWGLPALYLDLQNDSILTAKVIRLFPLPEMPILLVLLTALLGGIMGGFACKTGDLFRRFFLKEKARYY
jgi:hypothetical protein